MGLEGARGPVAVVILGAIAGCDLPADSVPAPPPAVAVTLYPSAARLAADGVLQLSAQVDDAKGRPIGGSPIQFQVSSDLASVTDRGLVRAKGRTGTVAVSAASGDRRATLQIQIVPGAPKQMIVERAAPAQLPVASRIDEPIVLRVVDSVGNGVANLALDAQCATEGCAVDVGAGVTDGEGRAQIAWTLGKKAGLQELAARVEGLSEPTKLSIQAKGGAARHLKVVARPGSTLEAGSEGHVFEVEATDAYGNACSGVRVNWVVATGGGEVSKDVSVTSPSGRARVELAVGSQAVPQRLFATAPAILDEVLVFDFVAHAARPAKLELVRGVPRRVSKSRPVRNAPVVRALDRFGNPVKHAVVRFMAQAGDSVDPQVMLTDEKGRATPTSWKLVQLGQRVLTASVADAAVRVTTEVRK